MGVLIHPLNKFDHRCCHNGKIKLTLAIMPVLCQNKATLWVSLRSLQNKPVRITVAFSQPSQQNESLHTCHHGLEYKSQIQSQLILNSKSLMKRTICPFLYYNVVLTWSPNELYIYIMPIFPHW